MNNDLMIDGGLGKIDAKLKELEANKPQAYSFKTNCRYNDTNIKTLSIDGLTAIVRSIGLAMAGYEYSEKIFAENNITVNDNVKKNLNDTLDDVLYLIKKLSWNQKKKELEDKKVKLEAFYSEDKKNQMSVEALLADL